MVALPCNPPCCDEAAEVLVGTKASFRLVELSKLWTVSMPLLVAGIFIDVVVWGSDALE